MFEKAEIVDMCWWVWPPAALPCYNPVMDNADEMGLLRSELRRITALAQQQEAELARATVELARLYSAVHGLGLCATLSPECKVCKPVADG